MNKMMSGGDGLHAKMAMQSVGPRAKWQVQSESELKHQLPNQLHIPKWHNIYFGALQLKVYIQEFSMIKIGK